MLGIVAVGVVFVGSGLLSFVVLRDLVHTPRQGRIAGIVMAAAPAVMVALAMVLRGGTRERRVRVASVALLFAACVLWVGGLAILGGRNPSDAHVAWMERVLPRFRAAFIVSMGVLMAVAGGVMWWLQRRRS